MKRILLISIVLVLVLMLFGACENKISEQERQAYLEQARQYDIKAATELALSREMSGRARGIWREWMSTDQREDYANYSRGASYHWEKYSEYSKEAEKYRQMAQSK